MLASTTSRASSWSYTNGLLTALSHAQSGVTLTDLTYAYDPDGQLTAILDNLDPTRSKAISYDQLNRLVQVAEGIPVAQGGVPVPVEDYAYDGEGNRTASHLSALYSSNGHNQLLEDERYGFDLSPLSARVEEFEGLRRADICGVWSKRPGRGSCIWSAASKAGSAGRRRDVLIKKWYWHILPTKESRLMVTRNVVLTETQDQLVQALVASGRYQNVSEAMRAGLRLLEQEEAQIAGIRQGLLEGLAQVKAGEFAEGSGDDAIRWAFRQARASS